MPKTNYNGTSTLGATKTVAPEMASRQSFFFQALGADMTLNFGASATATDILVVKSNTSVNLVRSGANKTPFPIEKRIEVFCASANAYNAQAEE